MDSVERKRSNVSSGTDTLDEESVQVYRGVYVGLKYASVPAADERAELRLADSSNENYSGFRASDSLTTSGTYTWPDALPTVAPANLLGQPSGVCDWATTADDGGITPVESMGIVTQEATLDLTTLAGVHYTQFVAPSTGRYGRVVLHCGNNGGTSWGAGAQDILGVGIYSNSASPNTPGVPRTRLSQSNALGPNSDISGEFFITTIPSVTLTRGTLYWFAIAVPAAANTFTVGTSNSYNSVALRSYRDNVLYIGASLPAVAGTLTSVNTAPFYQILAAV